MNAKRLITIAIAATLLIGGVAAVGAASPADTAAQNATNASDDSAPGETTADDDDDDAPTETGADDGENASEEQAGNADDRASDADGVGPSDGLPEQVPDRVSEIHETIDSFLNGSDDGLGSSLSDLLSGDTAADGTAEDAEDADGNSNADDEEMS